jgi:C1A family cysteine protease
MMTRRPLLLATLLAGCAQPSDGLPTAPPDDLPPLGKTDEVFHGAPANGDLPSYAKADDVYPAKFDLLATQSPVKNQNRRGVCTIFTTTALMEHLYIVAGMDAPSFSEQYLQWSVKAQLGVLPNSEGSNIDDNILAVNQYGIVTEDVDPYRGTQWTAADDPDCKPDGTETQQLPMTCWTQGDPTPGMQAASRYFLPAGRYLSTTDIKMHMTATGTAVAVAIPIYYQAWNYPHKLPTTWDDYYAGTIRYPNDDDIADSNGDPAGHGILLVGWDDDLAFQKVDKDDKPIVDADGKPVMETGFYIFKNSWGTTSFGKNNPAGQGYGYIPERYIADFASAYVTDPPTLPAGP